MKGSRRSVPPRGSKNSRSVSSNGSSLPKRRVPLLQALEHHLTAALDAELKSKSERRLTDEEIADVTQKTALTLSGQLLADFLQRAPEMLAERRAFGEGFQKRNLERWGEALDLLETMAVMAGELGEACGEEGRAEAIKTNDYVFEALSQLVPRAILVTNEVICLLSGGFPDGALSRWRTLHEITVTAIFISQQDPSVAHRYLASFFIQAKRAAAQFNQHAARANLKPFSDEEIAAMDLAAANAEAEVGHPGKGDYGWAAVALNRERPTFEGLEKAVDMDHWRPRYRWASQHTHSGFRPADRLLGMAEAKEPLYLIGRSNSGFVDPLQMTAISLWQIVRVVLLKAPNLDRLVYVDVLRKLAERVGQVAIDLETKKNKSRTRTTTTE